MPSMIVDHDGHGKETKIESVMKILYPYIKHSIAEKTEYSFDPLRDSGPIALRLARLLLGDTSQNNYTAILRDQHDWGALHLVVYYTNKFKTYRDPVAIVLAEWEIEKREKGLE